MSTKNIKKLLTFIFMYLYFNYKERSIKMTIEEYNELIALWNRFSVPKAQTEVNKKLLRRLKYLVTLKLRSEIYKKF